VVVRVDEPRRDDRAPEVATLVVIGTLVAPAAGVALVIVGGVVSPPAAVANTTSTQ